MRNEHIDTARNTLIDIAEQLREIATTAETAIQYLRNPTYAELIDDRDIYQCYQSMQRFIDDISQFLPDTEYLENRLNEISENNLDTL